MRLLLVRHGETAWNTEIRYQGHNPIPLNQRGRDQARRTGSFLGAAQAQVLYASDIARAWETALIIGQECGLTPQSLPDLREIDDGQWAGLTPAELWQRFPDHMAEIQRNPDTTVRLGGESYAQLQLRTIRAFEHVAQQHADQTVIAVSHGGAIRALVCHILGAPLAAYRRLWIDNGGIVEIIAQPEATWRVLKLNQTCHLSGPMAQGE